jgi:hypothetical protein
MNDLSHDADDRPGGRGEASGWKAVYRDWAASVHDMVEAWALQRGVDLVVFSTPEVEQDRQARH